MGRSAPLAFLGLIVIAACGGTGHARVETTLATLDLPPPSAGAASHVSTIPVAAARACPEPPRAPPLPSAPVTAATPQSLASPSCGNGKREMIGRGPCAPCMPGHSCPCAEIWEECDGADFGGASCSTRGMVSGSLRCTRACQIDASDCTFCASANRVQCARLETIPREAGHGMMLAMASNGAEVLAAHSSCGAVALTRVSPDLAVLGRSPSFGHADNNAIELIATPTGWLLATSAGGTTEVSSLNSHADVPARSTRITNATPVAWAANADRTRFLLALRSPGARYGGGLDVAIVAADGRVIAGPAAVFGADASDSTDFTIAHAAQTTAVGAAFAHGAFFVARAQRVVGVEGPRIAVARIDPATGVPSTRTIAFDKSAWRPLLAWTGSELRLVYQTLAAPTSPASWGWALESIPLDRSGHASGPATTLAMPSAKASEVGGIGVIPIAMAPSGAWILTTSPSSTGNTIVAPWMVSLSLIDTSPPAPQTVLIAREPAIEYPAVAEAKGTIVVGWLSRTGFGTPSTLTLARE